MPIEALYISRDRDGTVFAFLGKPEIDRSGEWLAGDRCRTVGVLPTQWFTDLKPGEFRRCPLKLEPEE